MSTVAFIRRMVEAGFSHDDALRAAEAFEATVSDMLPEAPVETAGARRTRRWRERLASQSVSDRHETSQTVTNVTDPLPLAPSPQTPQPHTPTPGKNTRTRKGASTQPASPEQTERVWRSGNQTSHDRSGRAQVAAAVGAALAEGASIEAIVTSVSSICSRQGTYAKGLHRIVAGGGWRDAMPRPEPPRELDPAYRAHCEAHYRATGEWRAEWGEKPSDQRAA